MVTSRSGRSRAKLSVPRIRLFESALQPGTHDSRRADVSVTEFMADHDWLLVTVDYAESFKRRWCGHIEWVDGTLRRFGARSIRTSSPPCRISNLGGPSSNQRVMTGAATFGTGGPR